MILCISLNPAVDKMVKLNTINIGKVNRGSLESVHAGGKAINVAYDLKIQGEDVLINGFVGGQTGNFIIEELKKRGLNFEFVRLATETRTSMNYIDANGNVTEILEGGHLVDALSEEKFLQHFTKRVEKADMVVLSGSLPIGLSDDMYGVLTDIANKAGVPVCLDTSKGALEKGIEKAPFLIKPNIAEMENLTNHKYDISSLDEGFEEFFKSSSFKNVLLEDLKEIRKKGVMIICLSMGEKGALFYVKDEIIVCKAPSVKVVNTVGSGDSLLAAFIHSLMKEASVLEACIYATAVASAHVTTMNVGDLDPVLVAELTKEVKFSTFKVSNTE